MAPIRAQKRKAQTEPDVISKSVTFNTLAKVLGNVFGPDSTDCCFQFATNKSKKTEEIKSHQKLLAALSSVFAAMFNGNWDDNSKPIPIQDASYKAFKIFIDYFYKGKVELTTNNIDEILYLAHKYDVQDLLSSCTAFAMDQLCAENVVDYLTIGIRFDQNNLVEECNEIIAEDTEVALKSEAFVRCEPNILKKILELEKKSCGWHIVFDACIEWAKNKCHAKRQKQTSPDNLRTALGECFGLIKFKEMGREELGKRYELFKAMFTKVESDEIFIHFIQSPKMSTGYCNRCGYYYRGSGQGQYY